MTRAANGGPPWHLIGAGGAGMSALGCLLLQRGERVSGSDAASGARLEDMRRAGAHIELGHAVENVPEGAIVVYSSAISPANTELVEAQRRGLRVLHRSQALAQLMAGYEVAAVAGTHGKTTVSAMVVNVLRAVGLGPSFAIGAEVPSLGGSAALAAQGGVFVVEADESDRSFLHYRPWLALITNIEMDHFEHYGDEQSMLEAFDDFLGCLRPAGPAVLCVDDPLVRRLADDRERRSQPTIRYGRHPRAQIRLGGTPAQWTVEEKGHVFPLPLGVPGEHNALNAVGALGALRGLAPEVPLGEAAASFAHFRGAVRRFERYGAARGVEVVDDYAHHPTEVRASIRAARELVGEDARVLVVFQPHLYSRTQQLTAEFAQALQLADHCWLLPIFGAREQPISGVSSALIAREAGSRSGGPFTLVADAREAVEGVSGQARRGDIVMTMGAGDITSLAPRILAALEDRPGEQGGVDTSGAA